MKFQVALNIVPCNINTYMFKNHFFPFIFEPCQFYFSLMNDICLSLMLPTLEYLWILLKGILWTFSININNFLF